MKLLFRNIAFIILAVNQISIAQINLNKVAQSTMNFLMVGTSPRASALGEAFTALGGGAESMFYNPAGLTEINNTGEITVGYTQWIADIKYLSGTAAWNFNNLGVVGINLVTVDYGTINGTSLISGSQLEQNPSGYIDNGKLSNVGAYAIGVSYAKSISEVFSVGGNVKIAGQNLGESVTYSGSKKNNAVKLVFDAGVKYYTGFNGFVFGMSIRNFSSNIKREEIDEQLPLTFAFGAAINVMNLINSDYAKNNSVMTSVDFLHQNNFSERVNVGLEYKFMDMLSLRAGYQTNRDIASWTGGIGFFKSFSDYGFQVNYSFSKMKVFDSVNRVSISFTF